VLAALADCGVQAATAVGPEVTVLQLTVVYALATVGDCGVQLAEGTEPVELLAQLVTV